MRSSILENAAKRGRILIAASQPGSESPASQFENELSALCKQLLEIPECVAPVVSAFPEQQGLPGIAANASKDDVVSKGEEAALDILSFFEEKEERAGWREIDDFETASVGDVPEPEPTNEDINSLRELAVREACIWKSATEIEKIREQKNRSPMQKMLDRERHHRGCARGACCVYSMWYDPKFRGHGNCAHKCTISHGAFARCGPSLFALGLPPLDYPGELRRDPNRIEWVRPQPVVRTRKRNRRVYSASHKEDNQEREAAVQVDAPLHHDHDAAVPEADPAHRKCVARRARTNVSTVSRVRKCMGRRSFGKLQDGKKVFRQLSRALEDYHKGM